MEMSDEIDKVTSADILKVARMIFGQECEAPVSLVVQGPTGAESYTKVLEEQGVGGRML